MITRLTGFRTPIAAVDLYSISFSCCCFWSSCLRWYWCKSCQASSWRVCTWCRQQSSAISSTICSSWCRNTCLWTSMLPGCDVSNMLPSLLASLVPVLRPHAHDTHADTAGWLIGSWPLNLSGVFFDKYTPKWYELRHIQFLPTRRMVLVVIVCLSVCLCVCLSYAGIVSKQLLGLSWFFAHGFPSTRDTQYFKEIRVSPKIRVLSPCNFVPNSGLRNSATACSTQTIGQVRHTAREIGWSAVYSITGGDGNSWGDTCDSQSAVIANCQWSHSVYTLYTAQWSNGHYKHRCMGPIGISW